MSPAPVHLPDPASVPFPEVQEAVLDAETLDSLFDDVHACAGVLEVVVKGDRAARARPVAPDLWEARRLLVEGEAAGVQVRYVYDGAEWWDTLLRAPEGYRLCRVRHVWGRAAPTG